MALYDCPQSPIYHGEGNVGIHTEMVVEALLQLPEYSDLSEEEKALLLAACIFHDVAKPVCTITEDGRIKSPRHAKVGEKMTREILWEEDFVTRELICSLVRLHGLPLWCLEKENPWSAVIASSLRVPNKLLYIFAKADVLGRICSDRNELLERIEYFKFFCLENNCFEKAYSFENDHSRFHYFLNNEKYPASLYDDTQFELVLMSGLPGSGKDTYVKDMDRPVISLDNIRQALKVSHGDKKGQGRVVQYALEQAKKFSASQQSFIWNSTNLSADIRAKLIRKLSVYKPAVKIVYVETSLENIYARRKEIIPRHKLDKMIHLLDMPQWTEVHELVYFKN